MKAWVGFVALALACMSCNRLEVHHEWVVDPPPNADVAATTIASVYGMKTIPTTYWYGAEFLNCAGGYGYKDQTGTCVSGDQEDGVVILPYYAGMTFSVPVPGSSTPTIADMGHEYAHQASDDRGEGGCADHKCHWFQPGGEGEQATGALALLGL